MARRSALWRRAALDRAFDPRPRNQADSVHTTRCHAGRDRVMATGGPAWRLLPIASTSTQPNPAAHRPRWQQNKSVALHVAQKRPVESSDRNSSRTQEAQGRPPKNSLFEGRNRSHRSARNEKDAQYIAAQKEAAAGRIRQRRLLRKKLNRRKGFDTVLWQRTGMKKSMGAEVF